MAVEVVRSVKSKVQDIASSQSVLVDSSLYGSRVASCGDEFLLPSINAEPNGELPNREYSAIPASDRV